MFGIRTRRNWNSRQPRETVDTSASYDARSEDDSHQAPSNMVWAKDLAVQAGGETLLAPVSFEFGAGSVLAIRGANGTGKTTLLRAVSGLIPAIDGAVNVFGERPRPKDHTFRRRVATMIGLPPFATDLTVRDHLRLVASTWRGLRDRADDAADESLVELGIERLGSRFPYELSSGQTQLFGLAITLVRPADLLVLDEPEQRLDTDRIRLLARALESRRARGATMLLATHSEQLTAAVEARTLNLKACS